jgi:hypothetical protein
MSAVKSASAPAGDAWQEAMARRGGREYTGGPVCWDASACEGVCRECRASGGRESQGGAA